MYARVAKWEGAEADAVRKIAQDMHEHAAEGPPEGVPAVGFTMLLDPDSGTHWDVALFETEEDLRKGDEALNNMNPRPEGGAGKRASVHTYEVPVEMRA